MSAPAAVSAPARSNRRIMWLWAPEFADGCYLGPYSTRRRRLSSITLAPCRQVMGVRGQRSQAAGTERGERNLIVLDPSDVLHDAFAVRLPGIEAEGEVRSGFHAIALTSSLPS